MKRINFKAVKVETSIDNFEKVDLRKEVGNILYKRAETVAQDDLSRKIYHSDGAVEMEEQDYADMMQVLEKSFVRYIYMAVANAVETGIAKNEQ